MKTTRKATTRNTVNFAIIMAILMFARPMQVNATEGTTAVAVEMQTENILVEEQLNMEQEISMQAGNIPAEEPSIISSRIKGMIGERNDFGITLQATTVQILNMEGVELQKGTGEFQVRIASKGQYDEETQKFITTPSYLGIFTGLGYKNVEVEAITLTRSDAESPIHVEGSFLYDDYIYTIVGTCLPKTNIKSIGGKNTDVASIVSVNAEFLFQSLELMNGSIYSWDKQLLKNLTGGKISYKNTEATQNYNEMTGKIEAYAHAVGTVSLDDGTLQNAKLISMVKLRDEQEGIDYIKAIMLYNGQKFWLLGEAKVSSVAIIGGNSQSSTSGGSSKSENNTDGAKEEVIPPTNGGIDVEVPGNGQGGVDDEPPSDDGSIVVPPSLEEGENDDESSKDEGVEPPSNDGSIVVPPSLEEGKNDEATADDEGVEPPPSNGGSIVVPPSLEEGKNDELLSSDSVVEAMTE